jgi:hypothetical protein
MCIGEKGWGQLHGGCDSEKSSLLRQTKGAGVKSMGYTEDTEYYVNYAKELKEMVSYKQNGQHGDNPEGPQIQGQLELGEF